jgi:hypothetical protein
MEGAMPPRGWSAADREDVGFFFTPPHVAPQDHRRAQGEHSTLYLLRREAQDCLYGRVIVEGDVREQQASPHRLFAATMVLMAGVDLLGRFLAPRGSVRARFVGFARAYLYPNPPDADALYAARNALMHSFGLYSTEARLVLSYGAVRDPPAVRVHDGAWLVDVEQFFHDFVGGVRAYEQDIGNDNPADDDLRRRFAQVFGAYGLLWIG